jgi:ubiquinone biosynthesis protein
MVVGPAGDRSVTIFSQFRRLVQIQWTIIRYGLDKLILSLPFFSFFRWLSFFNPWHWWGPAPESRGVALRMAMQELGPIFVKFGQMLSTRPDIIPIDITRELAVLQDNVAPFPGVQARDIIEQSLGQSISALFKKFEIIPLASASIAQVHVAELHNGKEVIVKVVRPGIESQIKGDIALLFRLARMAERYSVAARRLRMVSVVAEFEHMLLDELDLTREAANASQLRRNFLNSPQLYIPEVHWRYTTHNVMVMERIYGIPVMDFARLHEAHIDKKRLAESGVKVFFKQVFRDRFFHADMHPGNVFVSLENPENPSFIYVDFGIAGTLTSDDQRYLAENLLAFLHRDYQRVAKLHLESGWLPADTRLDQFEAAIRTVAEPVLERPLSEISCGHLLLGLFNTARRFNMEIQPQLLLLQKTLLAIEGIARQLDPNLDLFATAKPELEEWMRASLAPRVVLRTLKDELPLWLSRAPEMPELLYQVLQNIARGPRAIQKRLTRRKSDVRKGLLSSMVAGGALIATGSVLSLAHSVSYVTISMISAGASIWLTSIWSLRYRGEHHHVRR